MSREHRGTGNVYQRYAIADERMLQEGAAKLEALLQAQRRGADGALAPNRQSNGKVGGLRHAVRRDRRRGNY